VHLENQRAEVSGNFEMMKDLIRYAKISAFRKVLPPTVEVTEVTLSAFWIILDPSSLEHKVEWTCRLHESDSL
jgi:hypothetical protein